MRTVSASIGAAAAGLAVLVGAYGTWLLTTPDYDGGRTFVGGVMVVSAGVLGLIAAAGLRISSRGR